MLHIRPDQLRILEQRAIDEHLDELVSHVQEFSPRLASVLGPSRTRAVVIHLVDRARQDGFFCRGPIQFYVDMGLLFGTSFSSDPQYPWVRELLGPTRSNDELETSTQLYERSMVALEQIHGTTNSYTWSALDRLVHLSATTLDPEHRLRGQPSSTY